MELKKIQTRDDSDDDDNIVIKTTRTMTKQQQARHDATGILAIGEVSDVYVPFWGHKEKMMEKISSRCSKDNIRYNNKNHGYDEQFHEKEAGTTRGR